MTPSECCERNTYINFGEKDVKLETLRAIIMRIVTSGKMVDNTHFPAICVLANELNFSRFF